MLGRCSVLLLALVGVQAQNEEGDSCVMRDTNVTGKCTPAHLCISAKNDFKQKGIRPTICGYSLKQPILCCLDESTTPQTPFSTPKLLNGDPRRVSERKCEQYSRESSIDYLPLIPGGVPVKLGEFPHMAAIGWIDFDGGYAFNCGGSLVSPRFVLTAGHCTWDPKTREPEPSIVRLGEHNINPNVLDGANPIDLPIKAIHKHPDYKPPVLYNDIALLEFVDIKFNIRIRPTCLWNQFGFGTYRKAIAIGWGTNDSRSQMLVPELQKVSLSLMSNEFCEPLLKEIKNRNWRGFRDTQLCAGELVEKKDTCQGDSGAPLLVESLNMFYVMGIVSFGPRCASSKPAVYTRVYKYTAWIEGIVWPGE